MCAKKREGGSKTDSAPKKSVDAILGNKEYQETYTTIAPENEQQVRIADDVLERHKFLKGEIKRVILEQLGGLAEGTGFESEIMALVKDGEIEAELERLIMEDRDRYKAFREAVEKNKKELDQVAEKEVKLNNALESMKSSDKQGYVLAYDSDGKPIENFDDKFQMLEEVEDAEINASKVPLNDLDKNPVKAIWKKIKLTFGSKSEQQLKAEKALKDKYKITPAGVKPILQKMRAIKDGMDAVKEFRQAGKDAMQKLISENEKFSSYYHAAIELCDDKLFELYKNGKIREAHEKLEVFKKKGLVGKGGPIGSDEQRILRKLRVDLTQQTHEHMAEMQRKEGTHEELARNLEFVIGGSDQAREIVVSVIRKKLESGEIEDIRHTLFDRTAEMLEGKFFIDKLHRAVRSYMDKVEGNANFDQNLNTAMDQDKHRWKKRAVEKLHKEYDDLFLQQLSNLIGKRKMFTSEARELAVGVLEEYAKDNSYMYEKRQLLLKAIKELGGKGRKFEMIKAEAKPVPVDLEGGKAVEPVVDVTNDIIPDAPSLAKSPNYLKRRQMEYSAEVNKKTENDIVNEYFPQNFDKKRTREAASSFKELAGLEKYALAKSAILDMIAGALTKLKIDFKPDSASVVKYINMSMADMYSAFKKDSSMDPSKNPVEDQNLHQIIASIIVGNEVYKGVSEEADKKRKFKDNKFLNNLNRSLNSYERILEMLKKGTADYYTLGKLVIENVNGVVSAEPKAAKTEKKKGGAGGSGPADTSEKSKELIQKNKALAKEQEELFRKIDEDNKKMDAVGTEDLAPVNAPAETRTEAAPDVNHDFEVDDAGEEGQIEQVGESSDAEIAKTEFSASFNDDPKNKEILKNFEELQKDERFSEMRDYFIESLDKMVKDVTGNHIEDARELAILFNEKIATQFNVHKTSKGKQNPLEDVKFQVDLFFECFGRELYRVSGEGKGDERKYALQAFHHKLDRDHPTYLKIYAILNQKPSGITAQKMLELGNLYYENLNSSRYENVEKMSDEEVAEHYLLADLSKDPSAKIYVASFRELARSGKLLEVKKAIRREFNDFMEDPDLALEPNKFSERDAWIHWELAKQQYYHTHPDAAESKGKDVSVDPLSNEKFQKTVVSEELGWEVYNYSSKIIKGKRVYSEPVFLKKLNQEDPSYKTIIELLKKDPAGGNALTDEDNIILGEAIKQNLQSIDRSKPAAGPTNGGGDGVKPAKNESAEVILPAESRTVENKPKESEGMIKKAVGKMGELLGVDKAEKQKAERNFVKNVRSAKNLDELINIVRNSQIKEKDELDKMLRSIVTREVPASRCRNRAVREKAAELLKTDNNSDRLKKVLKSLEENIKKSKNPAEVKALNAWKGRLEKDIEKIENAGEFSELGKIINDELGGEKQTGSGAPEGKGQKANSTPPPFTEANREWMDKHKEPETGQAAGQAEQEIQVEVETAAASPEPESPKPPKKPSGNPSKLKVTKKQITSRDGSKIEINEYHKSRESAVDIIAHSNSFDELISGLDSLKDFEITGSTQKYSKEDILEIIKKIRTRELPTHYATARMGLRSKLETLLADQSEDYLKGVLEDVRSKNLSEPKMFGNVSPDHPLKQRENYLLDWEGRLKSALAMIWMEKHKGSRATAGQAEVETAAAPPEPPPEPPEGEGNSETVRKAGTFEELIAIIQQLGLKVEESGNLFETQTLVDIVNGVRTREYTLDNVPVAFGLREKLEGLLSNDEDVKSLENQLNQLDEELTKPGVERSGEETARLFAWRKRLEDAMVEAERILKNKS